MVLKTSQLSFEVIKNDSLLSGGRYWIYCFLENWMEDWIYLATLANYLLKALAMSKGFLLNDSREHCTKNEVFH